MATVVAVAASPLAGETLKEQADRLCHAYIDTPEAFTEVPTRPCTAQETKQFHTYVSYCLTHAVDGLPELQGFASVATGGSCGSTSIENLNRSTPLRNATVNGYGFGQGDKALDYQDHLLITGGNDLRLKTADEEIILCEFVHEFDGWQAPEPADSELCRKFSRGEYMDGAVPIAEQERQAWPTYSGARSTSHVRSDLDGDGSVEQIVGYDYSWSGGCGCSAKPLMLVHEGRTITTPAAIPAGTSLPPALKELGSALFQLTMVCGRERRGTKWFIVRINGKDFVLADFRPDRWDKWPSEDGEYLRSPIPSRELYEFRGDKFVKVCEQRPSAKKAVAHEVVPKEEYFKLNYAPVTEE